MCKKISFKIGILFTFMLLFLFTFKSPDVLASDSKFVTVSVPQSIVVPNTVIGNVMQSISNSTYNYNDGAYKGTLQYAGVSDWTETLYAQYPDMALYTYTFNVSYSGTVSVIEKVTKTVTVTVPQSIVVPNTVINNVMQSIANGTYNYDDGGFRGTLSYVGISNWAEAIYAQYPDVTIYRYTFDVTYTGTVTSYQMPSMII